VTLAVFYPIVVIPVIEADRTVWITG